MKSGSIEPLCSSCIKSHHQSNTDIRVFQLIEEGFERQRAKSELSLKLCGVPVNEKGGTISLSEFII